MNIERRGADAIGELEQLWLALKNHHGSVTPEQPVRADAQSWELRRADYERWLAEDGAFVLIARQADAPVGFALVRVTHAGPTWPQPERYATVQDLCVAPGARGGGVGRALLDRVHDESGCELVELEVLSSNAPAVAFYERIGFEPHVERLRRWRAQ